MLRSDVTPLHSALSIHHVVLPLSFVVLLIVDPYSIAIAQAVDEITFEDGAGSDPPFDAITMLHVKLPLSLINCAESVGVGSLPMGHRVLKLSNVPIAKAVSEHATTIRVSKLPLSLIRGGVTPLHPADAVSEVTQPSAHVDTSVFIPVLAWLRRPRLGHKWLSCQRLEDFVSREVPRVHPVHVSHLDALTNRFARKQSSYKGLNLDD